MTCCADRLQLSWCVIDMLLHYIKLTLNFSLTSYRYRSNSPLSSAPDDKANGDVGRCARVGVSVWCGDGGILNCPVRWAEDGEDNVLYAATALSMSDRCAVSSPTGGRLTAELSVSGFAGLSSSLEHAAAILSTCRANSMLCQMRGLHTNHLHCSAWKVQLISLERQL